MTDNRSLEERKKYPNILTEQNKLLRYDANTRQIEKIKTAKKCFTEEMDIVKFLDNRKKRILTEYKEKDVIDMAPDEIK